MMNHLSKELIYFETKLPSLTFSKERSNLHAVNSNFFPFGGKNFLSWLNFLSSKKKLMFWK